MFWSREQSTVSSILSNVRKGKRMSEALNLSPVDPPMGPWPVGDQQGFQVALEMIRASQLVGKNSDANQQFDTIRKLRSAYSAIYESSPSFAHIGLTFKGGFGKLVHFTHSPLNGLLFRQFMTGLEKRMGRIVCQDLGLDVRVLVAMMDQMESELRDLATTWERKRHLVICGSAFVTLYAGALRGGEPFLMEGKELCKRIRCGKRDPRMSHVYAPYMGRFKHETGERNLMLVFASETNVSRIPVRIWLERLVFILKKEGKDSMVGPALCDMEGYVYPYWKVNGEFHSQLEKVRETRGDLIDKDVDVEDRFNIFRSFRRGATTRAREMGVGGDIISLNNRWRKSQNSAGGVPKLPMVDLYTEIQQALLTRLRFSSSL